MSIYNLRPTSEWVVKYDTAAKLKDAINTKSTEVKGLALLSKILMLSKQLSMEKALQSNQLPDYGRRPMSFLLSVVLAGKNKLTLSNGEPNALLERLAGAIKSKFNLNLFAKQIKDKKKNEERRRLGFTRVEYHNFMQYYKKLKAKQDVLIDGPDSVMRFRQLYLREPKKDDNYEDCTEQEAKELKKRLALDEWVKSKEELITDLIRSTFRLQIYESVKKEDYVKAKIRRGEEIDPDLRHMQDYNTYFMEMMIATQPVKNRIVEGTA